MLSWVEHEKKFYNLGAWKISSSLGLKGMISVALLSTSRLNKTLESNIPR